MPMQFPRSTKLATKFVKVHCATGHGRTDECGALDCVSILKTAEHDVSRNYIYIYIIIYHCALLVSIKLEYVQD